MAIAYGSIIWALEEYININLINIVTPMVIDTYNKH